MDPPRRKSLRFASKVSSTPEKKAKKAKKRPIPGPYVPNAANVNDEVNDNNDPTQHANILAQGNDAVIAPASRNMNNDNNDPIQPANVTPQVNDAEIARMGDIIDEYGQVLQQESEQCIQLAFQSENWMELEIKLGVVEHRWIKLNDSMREAIEKNDNWLERKYRTVINIVEPYYQTAKEALGDRVKYLKHHKINPAQGSSLNFSRESNQTINVQLDPTDFYLKPVELESFDGNYAKWTSFREDFVDQVHNNDKIKAVNKLRRLKALVKGQAAVTLGNWQASSTGYTAAWDKLCRVYDNPYLIARAHIEDMFSVPSINNRLTHESLRMLIDTVTNAKRQLEEMDVNVIDLLIMHIMCKKLDDRTCSDWEMKRSSQDIPQLNQFIDFLEKKARALTNIDNKSLMFSSTKAANTTPNNRSNDRRFKPYTTNNRNERVNTNSATSSTAKETKDEQEFRPCQLCHANHGLFRCTAFFGLTLKKRLEKVQEWNLCKNCLNPYHDIRYCKVNKNPCRRCPGEYHNSSLCPNFIYNQTSVTATVTSTSVNETKASGESTKDKTE